MNNNTSKNTIGYIFVIAYCLLFSLSIFISLNNNSFSTFSISIQLSSLLENTFGINNFFAAFYLFEFYLIAPLIYFLTCRLLRVTISSFDKYAVSFIASISYLFLVSLLAITSKCIQDICFLEYMPPSFPAIIIFDNIFLASFINSILVFIFTFLFFSILEIFSFAAKTAEKYYPYLPSLIYIAIFSILAICLPLFKIMPSLLGHIFPPLAFFEFIFASITIYFFTKRFFHTPRKEEAILPVLVTCGYFAWALPLIIYSLTCSDKFCSLASIFPLSFFWFINVPIITPLLGLVLNGFIAFYITKYFANKY